MKITTDKAVYVQKNDLGYLLSSDIPVPGSVFMKTTGAEFMIIDDSNRYEFVKFDQEEEIKFFNEMDWMVEYNDVKDLSIGDIMDIEMELVERRNNIAGEYNMMSEKERKKRYDMVSRCELLEFKVHSLSDIIGMKQGALLIKLPKEVDDTKGKRRVKGFFKKSQ